MEDPVGMFELTEFNVCIFNLWEKVLDFLAWVDWAELGAFLNGLGTLGLAILAYLGVSQWRREHQGRKNLDKLEELRDLIVELKREIELEYSGFSKYKIPNPEDLKAESWISVRSIFISFDVSYSSVKIANKIRREVGYLHDSCLLRSENEIMAGYSLVKFYSRANIVSRDAGYFCDHIVPIDGPEGRSASDWAKIEEGFFEEIGPDYLSGALKSLKYFKSNINGEIDKSLIVLARRLG